MDELIKAKTETINKAKHMIEELQKTGQIIKIRLLTPIGSITGDITEIKQDPINSETNSINTSWCASQNPEYFICVKNAYVKTNYEATDLVITELVICIDQIIAFHFVKNPTVENPPML